MPPPAAIIARDQRILAAYSAGTSLREIALTENVEPAIVRRALQSAGIAVGPFRRLANTAHPDRLADRDWLAAEYAAKSGRQIARELGCTAAAVYEALQVAGIPRRVNASGPRCEERIAPEEVERAVSLYQAGHSARRVAKEVGLSPEQIGRLIEKRTLSDGSSLKRSRSEAIKLGRWPEEQRAHDKPKREKGWPSEVAADVLARYAGGASGEQIARDLGVSESRVYRLLRQRGVVRPIGMTKRKRARMAPEGTEVMPAELAEQALARYAAGEPVNAVALALGVSGRRVYRLLSERGALRSRSAAKLMQHARKRAAQALCRPQVEPPAWPARGVAWPADLAAAVVDRYDAGDSVLRIADDLGVGFKRVHRLLSERGVLRSRHEAGIVREGRKQCPEYVHRPGAGVSAEVVDALVARYQAGESVQKLAPAFGLKECRVYWLLRDRGVLRSMSEAAKLRDAGQLRLAARRVPRARVQVPAGLAEQVLMRYAAGEPVDPIALALGLPRRQVYLLLKERGVLRSMSEAQRVQHARKRAVDA